MLLKSCCSKATKLITEVFKLWSNLKIDSKDKESRGILVLNTL